MSSDAIRHSFSLAMSKMYQTEVPLYTELMELVAEVNEKVLAQQPEIAKQLKHTGEMDRLNMERHGAIRLGTAAELTMMRRLFAVMGMQPVGYYDLAPAGVPVHSTAFRAIDTESLNNSPFRVFTSLLRLDLIDDETLKQQAQSALDARNIFTDGVVRLIEAYENEGGLTKEQGEQFVQEALETFRWHEQSPIAKDMYQQLASQHQLIADVVGFKGPHINHLTPRTLDIDAVQQGMQSRGIPPKAIIEGPPRRNCPILLRQTSFKALEEPVSFRGADGQYQSGHHTARFGEIEQRGVALTPKGRALYDQLLNEAREKLGGTPNESNAEQYYQLLSESFAAFPDDYQTLHDEQLAYFHYQPNETCSSNLTEIDISTSNLQQLIEQDVIRIEPIVYEDFLPVSAAGIFQSNLHSDTASSYDGQSNQQEFEQALGESVQDELALYAQRQEESLQACLAALQQAA
ncbi:2-oxoadipate dioxygenase/decarboxylase HglS [Psychrobacter pygoscelis]|uniref:2-oxoadipate dioxygenase/decarboxylase HglS n=1 Tax=Psychrobacter pygoscelis TaxID=2488563 RepID=UPI00104052C7|nr:VOC family protein [Psychrobacter pygoscelis]